MQTEDSGVDNPHLFTHLFHGGVIISSRKIDYDAASAEDVVKGLMQSQHKAVLKDLKIGTFDDKIDAYLGDKTDLLPRKADAAGIEPAEVDLAAETEPSIPAPIHEDSRTHTEATAQAPVGAAPPADEPLAAQTQATEPAPIPATPEPAHSGAISLDTPNAVIPQVVAPATIPMHVPSEAMIDLEPRLQSSTRHRYERIPTPLALPAVSAGDLGDPKVTFTESAAPVEIPPDSVGELSATHSYQRPAKRKRSSTQARYAPASSQSQAPQPSASGRPTGKSANPEPGERRSSVVVSRPSVIVGSPARSVGGESNRRTRRRTPPNRKSRSRDLFGNDTVSEKSLDEVIMAYLSEDNGDE
ncbi:MAG: hypothetical protein GY811_01700 [Myxococcales bacterium]|nr:hypothetical protein [Myxococcales bacterium]